MVNLDVNIGNFVDVILWLDFYNGVVVGFRFVFGQIKIFCIWIVYNKLDELNFLYVGLLMVLGLYKYFGVFVVMDVYCYFFQEYEVIIVGVFLGMFVVY